jgi:hypothetical protein
MLRAEPKGAGFSPNPGINVAWRILLLFGLASIIIAFEIAPYSGTRSIVGGIDTVLYW